MRDDLGNPLILQGIAFDITDIKKAEIAIRDAQDTKIRTERLAAVGQLAASIGHDLRNPLAAVRNAMHFIKKRIGEHEDPRVRQFMDLIERELKAANRIIGDLLDFARARPAMLVTVELRDVVEDAISIVQPPRTMEIQDLVPAKGLLVDLDRDQFRQVLVNLVQNAAEAMPVDRVGNIRVTSLVEGRIVRIDVIDNGIGIPADKLEKIFEPLYTTKAKGTGLGLAIVSNIVQGLGGKLTVTSREHVGTTFSVTLPLSAAEVVS